MNTKGRNQGQLILVAGFLVAIAIIGVAMTLSGVFFTQNVDESGLSQFESSATTQQASADVAAKRSFDLTNLLSQRTGMTTDELNETLINYMRNYTKTTQNVSQLQAVINVTLNNKTINRSWVAGRKKPGVLPGWNVTNETVNNNTQKSRLPIDMVFVLDTTGSMGFDYDHRPVYSGYNGSHSSSFSSAELKTSWSNSTFESQQEPGFCSDPDFIFEYCEHGFAYHDDNPSSESRHNVDNTDVVVDDQNTVNDLYGGDPDDAIGQYVLAEDDNGVRPLAEVVNYGYDSYGNFYWRIEYVNDNSKFERRWVRASNEDLYPMAVADGYDASSGEWTLNYRGTTEVRQVDEDQVRDLDYKYRYWVPRKMHYAKQAMKAAIGVMNGTASKFANRSDRAGLVEFDTDFSPDEANFLQTITNVSGNKPMLNNTVDGIYDNNAGTNITAGLEMALEGGGGIYDTTANNDQDHIVLLSDGQNSDSSDDSDAVDLSNEAENRNVTIHTIAFGDNADESLLQQIKTTNGTYSKADPDNIIDVLEGIVKTVQSKNRTITRTSKTAASDAIDRIYELQMNVTEFNNGESLSINITNTTTISGTNKTRSVWKLTVNNTEPTYEINLTSDTAGINKEMEITPPSKHVNNSGNWIYFDVMSNEVRNETRDLSFDLRPDIIKPHYPVSFELKNTNKSANGTFNFEFEPKGNNYSIYNNGKGVGDVCTNPGPCGYQNNTNSTYSTAKIRHADITVKYNSAQGDYENTIEIDSD